MPYKSNQYTCSTNQLGLWRIRGAVVLHGLVKLNELANFFRYSVSCFPAVLWVTARVTGNLTCRESVHPHCREIMCTNTRGRHWLGEGCGHPKANTPHPTVCSLLKYLYYTIVIIGVLIIIPSALKGRTIALKLLKL